MYSDSLFTVMTDLTTPEKLKIDSLFVRLSEYQTIDKLDVLNLQIVDSSKYSLLNWIIKIIIQQNQIANIYINIGYRTTTNHIITTNFTQNRRLQLHST
jgi:hypothetical protein